MSSSPSSSSPMVQQLQAIHFHSQVPQYIRRGAHIFSGYQSSALMTVQSHLFEKDTATISRAFGHGNDASQQPEDLIIKRSFLDKFPQNNDSSSHSQSVENPRREAAVLNMVHHPNVINASYTWTDDTAFGIAMPDAGTCDLLDYINLWSTSGARGVSRRVMRKIMIQVISGLQHMHHGVVDEAGQVHHLAHGDLSPENIIIAHTHGDIDSFVERAQRRFGNVSTGEIEYPGGCIRLPSSAFSVEHRREVPFATIIDTGGAFSMASPSALCSHIITPSSSSTSTSSSSSSQPMFLLGRGKRQYTAHEMPGAGKRVTAPFQPSKLDTWAVGAIMLTGLTGKVLRQQENLDSMPVIVNGGGGGGSSSPSASSTRRSSLWRECARSGEARDASIFRSALITYEMEYRRSKVIQLINHDPRYQHLRHASARDIDRLAEAYHDDHAMTPSLIDFLVHTLDWNFESRYDIDQLASHPFLREVEEVNGMCMVEEALPFTLTCHTAVSNPLTLTTTTTTTATTPITGYAVAGEEEAQKQQEMEEDDEGYRMDALAAASVMAMIDEDEAAWAGITASS